MSPDALQQRLSLHAATAAPTCPALASKNHSPRPAPYRRHALLHAGVDITVIALWLGHESVTTTQIYLQADIALKQQALNRTTPPARRSGPLPAPDSSRRSSSPVIMPISPGPGTAARQRRAGPVSA